MGRGGVEMLKNGRFQFGEPRGKIRESVSYFVIVLPLWSVRTRISWSKDSLQLFLMAEMCNNRSRIKNRTQQGWNKASLCSKILSPLCPRRLKLSKKQTWKIEPTRWETREVELRTLAAVEDSDNKDLRFDETSRFDWTKKVGKRHGCTVHGSKAV